MGVETLVATGVGLAYDQFVSKPERERAASNATKIQQQEFDRQMGVYSAEKAKRDAYLEKYESFVNNLPDTGYDQGVIDAKYQNVLDSVNTQAGTQRKQILNNLATRGVRTSGISEQSLGDLERRKLDSLATARNNLTIEQLLADRTARTNKANAIASFYATASGGAPQMPSSTALTNAQINEANQPLYNNAVLQSLLSYAGQAAGYGKTATAAPASGLDPVTASLASRNLGYGSSPTDLIYTRNPLGAYTY